MVFGLRYVTSTSPLAAASARYRSSKVCVLDEPTAVMMSPIRKFAFLASAAVEHFVNPQSHRGVHGRGRADDAGRRLNIGRFGRVDVARPVVIRRLIVVSWAVVAAVVRRTVDAVIWFPPAIAAAPAAAAPSLRLRGIGNQQTARHCEQQDAPISYRSSLNSTRSERDPFPSSRETASLPLGNCIFHSVTEIQFQDFYETVV